MELERNSIERTDFSAARRGYDPEEVDRHLRQIAEAVDELKSAQGGAQQAPSVAGAAAEQVRVIVEAAENSASEIERNARTEADRVTGEASRSAQEEKRSAEEAARETREKASAEAAAHVEGVQDATGRMLERADTIESDLNGLVEELRSSVTVVVSTLRDGAGGLRTNLEELRSGLADVGAAGAAAPVGEAAPVDAEPEVVEEVQETTADAAHEAAVEPEAEAEVVEPEVEEVEAPAEEPETADAEVVEEAVEAEPEEAEAPEAVEEEEAAEPEAAPAAAEGEGAEGARLIALNMALNGTPREETARYLQENFDLSNTDAILDEVYARVGG